ncbi:hypothetical protein LWI29_007612 [Acer saccharum]|uniref:RRM domain-containing protein n=1 Tax=Acer saccharum TaxID=4024 RepID=A0AA39SBV5_ACESA|nr:hypothetical protein LWI29_007612 [Acer saccharum]
MRESRRETSSAHVKGSSQARYETRRDFRDSLFSVYIDNINPVVDYEGLWGIFKPFGRIRDIFKSSKSQSRRSCYAFLRFATAKEAQRVVDSVNGMHIYGWPIKAKMADSGWSRRRDPVPRQDFKKVEEEKRANKVRNHAPQFGDKERSSYAEMANFGTCSKKGEGPRSAIYHGGDEVNDGRVDFKVSVMEEIIPVAGEWVDSHLGLVKGLSPDNSNCSPERVRSDICRQEEVAVAPYSSKRRQRKDHRHVAFQDKVQVDYRRDELFEVDRWGGRSAHLNLSNHQPWKAIVSPNMAKDKAKKIYQRKPRALPSVIFDPKAKLILEKRKVNLGRVNGSSLSESSESEDNNRQGQFFNSAFCRGENSKSCDGLSERAYRADVDRWIGTAEAQPSSKSNSSSSGESTAPFDNQEMNSEKACLIGPSNSISLNQSGRNDLCVCVNSMFKGRDGSKGNHKVSSGANPSMAERETSEAYLSKICERKKKTSLNSLDSQPSFVPCSLEDPSVEVPGPDLGGSQWNLEKEFAKVIEKGVSLGVDLKSFKEVVGSDKSWNLEVEIAKVIETGMALGFEFNMNDKVVSEAIATREIEDVTRFQELQK